MTTTTGVRLKTKSMKPSPVALPIMMLGGSPINVAVPPMLEAIISVIRNGSGLILSWPAMAKVTGTIKSTVVTLSRRADRTAVIRERAASIFNGSPLELLAALTARYSKTPVCLVMPTMSIMPTKSPMVLKSMASTAFSGFMMPRITTRAAPAKATMVR